MKNALSIFVSLLFLAVVAVAQSVNPAGEANQSIRDRFLGAWRLTWLEEPDARGELHRADCSGLLVFTPGGHMSVQVMYRNPTSDKQSPERYTLGGYEASFGKYEINGPHTFTFHVEGALVRSLVGKDLDRVFEFSGDELIVKSPDPSEHWKVAWTRY